MGEKLYFGPAKTVFFGEEPSNPPEDDALFRPINRFYLAYLGFL